MQMPSIFILVNFLSISLAQFDFSEEVADFFQFGKLSSEGEVDNIGNSSTKDAEPPASSSIAQRRSQPFTVFADITQTSTTRPVSLGHHLAEDKLSDLVDKKDGEEEKEVEGVIEERDLGHGHGGGFSHGGGGHGGGHGGGYGGGHVSSGHGGYGDVHGGGGYGDDHHGGGGYGDDHGGHGGYSDDHGGHGGYGDDHKGGLVNYGIHSGKKVTF